MSKVSLKKNFKDGTKLLSAQLNTNFEAIEKAIDDNFSIIENVSDISSKIDTKVDKTTYNSDISNINSSINTKVDKVTGKGLSSNDYTTEEKTKLAELSNYDDTEVRGLINNKQDKGNYALKSEIPTVPTNVSAFTNDAGYLTEHQSLVNYALKSEIPDVSNFITNTVNNLTNYYLKSETYTKTEVNNLIGQIQGISIEKVDVLPATGDSKKIYLVPKQTSKTSNIYTEYIYINNNWEIIGDTEVDLSNYYTKTESDSRYLQSFTETDPTVPAWAKESTKPTYTASEVGALPNTTYIPTKTSDLTNDSYFVTKTYVDGKTSKATTSNLGLVKPDGTTITITDDGTISSSGGGGASYTAGTNIEIANNNVINNTLTKTSQLTNDSNFVDNNYHDSTKQDKKYFVITEDIVTVEKDSTKGISPYNTSYGYTNITINDNAGIEWVNGGTYYFVINTKMIVASANRNVRIRIGESGDWKPLYFGNAIAVGSSYFTKAYNTVCTYKTTYQTNGAVHILSDNSTTYSAITQAEIDTGTSTATRGITAKILKDNLNKKVDKVEGKILSTNDYTNEDKSKLISLENYDDTDIRLSLNNKQDIISDLDTIRSNATSGKSASDTLVTSGDGSKYLANDGNYKTVESGASYTAGTNIEITSGNVINNTGNSNKYKNIYGKKIAFLGDSLTEPYLATTGYVQYLVNDCNITAQNLGITGSTIANETGKSSNPFVTRYTQINSDTDYIFVMGGGNDAIKGVTIGTNDDNDGTTFKGALNVLIKGLATSYPNAKIAFSTMTPFNNDESEIDNVLDYMNAIQEICQKWSIPCLNLYSCLGINPNIPTHYSTYYADGLHPNAAGHRIMADKIKEFLNNLNVTNINMDYYYSKKQVDSILTGGATVSNNLIEFELSRADYTAYNSGVSMTLTNNHTMNISSSNSDYWGFYFTQTFNLEAGKEYTFSCTNIPANTYMSLNNDNNMMLNSSTLSKTFTPSSSTTSLAVYVWCDGATFSYTVWDFSLTYKTEGTGGYATKEYVDNSVKDTVPYGSIVKYDGTTVPDGYVQVSDPNDYSTTEQVIGTWIDGKPLYRRVFTSPINGSSCTISTGLVNYSLVSLNSYITDGSKLFDGNTYRGVEDSYSSRCYFVENQEIKFYTMGADRTGYNLIAILEYTKTTD